MISFWSPVMSALMDLLQAALPWIIAALAVVVAGIAGRRAGRKQAKTETALEAAERYARQRKAMDDEDAVMGDDPAVLRDGLRQRDPSTR